MAPRQFIPILVAMAFARPGTSLARPQSLQSLKREGLYERPQQSLGPGAHLAIHFSYEDPLPPEDLRRACLMIGHHLSVGHGPWGYGIFSGFHCLAAGNYVMGPKKPSAWRLRIVVRDLAIYAALYYGFSKDAPPLAKAKIPTSPLWNHMLGDRRLSLALAYHLLEQLPFLAAFDTRAFTDRTPMHRFETSAQDLTWLAPPLNTLNYGVFIGSAETSKIEKGSMVGAATLERETGHVEGDLSYYYRRTKHFSDIPPLPVWGFRPEFEPSRLTMTRASLLAEARRLLDRSATDFVGLSPIGGYIAGRYSASLSQKKDDPIAESRIASVLARIKTNGFGTLSLFFDKLLLSKANHSAGETSLTWQRLLVGWGFGLEIPDYLGVVGNALWFNITPKIGTWSLRADLPRATSQTTYKIETIEIKKAISTGVEVDTTFSTPAADFRLWYAFDSTFFDTGEGSRVTSNKFGIDGIWQGPVLLFLGPNWNFSFFAFGFYDSATITTKISSVSDSSKEIPAEISLAAPYAGLGLGLTW